ncbi:primosomal protein N' family DNA-binding protein [Trueperella bernardiae]|uniref:primosomal protein N' family DNA-binding protein n=1 Tax=Trueperella bernardiae TaxID=59561 RepID=UPI00374F7312
MTNDELFGLPDFGHQEELLSLSPVARRVSGVDRPVARVLLDMPQPHMDHLFDYEIPEKMAAVEEGARVVVNVGQRKVDGFVVGGGGGGPGGAPPPASLILRWYHEGKTEEPWKLLNRPCRPRPLRAFTSSRRSRSRTNAARSVS